MEHHHESLFADPRFWVGVSFVIFFLIFGRKLWAAVTGMLDRRTATIRGELDEAARLRREAESMFRDAEAKRTAALAEAEALMKRAHEEAAQAAAAARADAATAASRRERMAMERIAAAEKAAVIEVRLAAADVATRAAQQVLTDSFGGDADAVLIDHAIQGLPAALSSRRAA